MLYNLHVNAYTQMKINIIVASDEQGAIGIDNKLPWKIPADMKRFKSLTTGHIVIMGRKTFESLPKSQPLKNRINVVISKSLPMVYDKHSNMDIVRQPPNSELLTKLYPNHSVAWVIGGSEIYNYYLNSDIVSKIYLTLVHLNIKKADAYIDLDSIFMRYKVVKSTMNVYDKETSYSFIDLERRT